jgi:hypothetical protein
LVRLPWGRIASRGHDAAPRPAGRLRPATGGEGATGHSTCASRALIEKQKQDEEEAAALEQKQAALEAKRKEKEALEAEIRKMENEIRI